MIFRLQQSNQLGLLVQVVQDNNKIWPKDTWYEKIEKCPYIINPRDDTVVMEQFTWEEKIRYALVRLEINYDGAEISMDEFLANIDCKFSFPDDEVGQITDTMIVAIYEKHPEDYK